MGKKDALRAARPTCLACKKPLTPNIGSAYVARNWEELKAKGVAYDYPVAFRSYGRRGDALFCGTECGYQWALAVGERLCEGRDDLRWRLQLPEKLKLEELERAQLRHAQEKARELRKRDEERLRDAAEKEGLV